MLCLLPLAVDSRPSRVCVGLWACVGGVLALCFIVSQIAVVVTAAAAAVWSFDFASLLLCSVCRGATRL